MWVVASKGGLACYMWFFLRWGVVPSYRLCELRILVYGRRKITMQPMKLPLTLWRMECGVQRLAVRLLCPFFFFENTINLECYIDIVHEFVGHLTEEKIAEAWFHQDSANVTQYGRLWASHPYCSEIESFRKDYGPHAHRMSPPDSFPIGLY